MLCLCWNLNQSVSVPQPLQPSAEVEEMTVRRGVPVINISLFCEAHIQDAVNSPTSHSAPEYIDGCLGQLSWHWYHLGDAHHFTTTALPENWDAFFFDTDWSTTTTGIFDQLLASGHRLSFLSELANDLKGHCTNSLPRVIESSWNPKRRRGIYA
jgi:hypothetical protein